MKKRVVALILIISFAFILSSVSALTNATQDQQKINNAYNCLENKTQGKCSALSTEEKIFSLLAVNQCSSELQTASTNSGECWGPTSSSGCKVKTTAQAVLALENSGRDSTKAQNWLLNQNKTPAELSWYLEIEASSASTCKISYGGISSTVSIGEDKKISSNAGNCLVLAQDDYWLRVSPSCYDESFEISCDQNFLTTLLFQRTGSSTVHVMDEASSAAANGITTEKVNSACFAEGSTCTYEGTLWAALVLDSVGKDISSYLPYIITGTEANEKYLPDSFLYFITADPDYRTSLLSKQKSGKWWLESSDKLYDTALALYPFQQETLPEKTNSQNWLLDTQDANGCWENNIRDTAFILSSIWPREFAGSGSGTSTGLPDCETSGYFCTPEAKCGGVIFSNYDCPVLSKCCSKPATEETCIGLGGEICSSGESCNNGVSTSSPDLNIGQKCCVGGSCILSSAGDGGTSEISECELSGGICRTTSCNSNEESISVSCDFSGSTCCVQEEQTKGNYTWVWILLILITLVVLGIIFRNYLRHFWFKIKDSFGGKHNAGGPGAPPYRPSPHYAPIRRQFPVERRILLPSSSSQAKPRSIASSAQKELDDVLKKLKEMSK